MKKSYIWIIASGFAVMLCFGIIPSVTARGGSDASVIYANVVPASYPDRSDSVPDAEKDSAGHAYEAAGPSAEMTISTTEDVSGVSSGKTGAASGIADAEEDSALEVFSEESAGGLAEIPASDDLSGSIYRNAVFIGDERAEDVRDTTGYPGDGNQWLCLDEQGIEWINNSAIETMMRYIDSRTAVVILPGIHDLGSAQEYADDLNVWGSYLKEHSGADLFVVSANPVSGKNAASNDSVIRFNETLRSGLGNATFIDTASCLDEEGYSCTADDRYGKEEASAIYRQIIVELKSRSVS